MVVYPAEVRLIPGPRDPYRWQRQPSKEYLFQRNLSKHSAKAYMDLFQSVGVSIKAVHPSASSPPDPSPLPIDYTDTGFIGGGDEQNQEAQTTLNPARMSGQAEVSCSSTKTNMHISKLEAEITRLSTTVRYWQDEAERNIDIKETLQNELQAERSKSEKLQSLCRKSKDQIRMLFKGLHTSRGKLMKAELGVRLILHVSRKLQAESMHNVDMHILNSTQTNQ